MKKETKKDFKVLYILICFVVSIIFINFKFNTIQAETIGMNVQYHTKEEIRNFIIGNNINITEDVIYDQKPSINESYELGKLSQHTQEAAITVLNQVRYIAGIDADVVLGEEFVQQVQASVLVNWANGKLNHYPSKPDEMPNELYELGKLGSGKSNLGVGYKNLNQVILSGWMGDSDDSNKDRVGHRRWCLNPAMMKTAFGVANDYYAMYALDESRKSSYTGVAWPAQTMPLQYFGNTYVWSFSANEKINPSNVKVILTRVSDNKVWTFSENKSNGYFNVSNERYGQNGCIIFRPFDIKYSDGDIFDVYIEGLSYSVQYQVIFFDLNIVNITLNKNEVSLIVGDTMELVANIEPEDVFNKNIIWSSSDETVATVSEQGEITALKEGYVIITATAEDSGKKASCKVIIEQKESQGKLGDVNNDGDIDVNDALVVLKIAASLITPTEEQRKAADVSGDGKVDSGDALLILKYAAGLITEL